MIFTSVHNSFAGREYTDDIVSLRVHVGGGCESIEM